MPDARLTKESPLVEDVPDALPAEEATDDGEPVTTSSSVPAGTDSRRGRRRHQPGSIVFTAAVITAGMGLLVAGFAVYLFGFTSLEAFHAQHRLAEQLAGSAGLAALNGTTPPEGEAVAILDIPTIGIRQVVVEGTSSEDLEAGPGLLIGSAPPGTGGDVVIAGRRTTYGSPFARLDRLKNGDTVILTGALGEFRYTVSTTRVVRPGSPLPASPTSAGRLTLVTSTPAVEASSLLVVTADLAGKPVASVPLSDAALPSTQFGLAGDGAAVAPAIGWGGALIGVLLCAWYLLRRSRKTWLVYGLATPIVIAAAILCYANVAALLPATL